MATGIRGPFLHVFVFREIYGFTDLIEIYNFNECNLIHLPVIPSNVNNKNNVAYVTNLLNLLWWFRLLPAKNQEKEKLISRLHQYVYLFFNLILPWPFIL